MKIFNFATTYAILMKLTAIVYFHKVFQLAKKYGITQKAQKIVKEKPLRINQKISLLA